MAMQQNLYYQDPAASIGASLGRALFGDPQMAMKQAQMQSEAEARRAAAREADAHAKLYTSQTGAKDVENTANTGLPALISSLYATHPATPARAPMGAESDDGGEIAAVPGVNAAQAFHAGLPAVIASMVQGGHGANIDGAIRALGAYGGDDEMARRALVAGGASPTKDFAITPERADQVASNLASNRLREALGVATINNRDDIPVAQINAGSAARVAGINHSNDLAVADIAAGSRRDVAGIRQNGGRYTGGWTPRMRNGGDNTDEAVDSKIAGASHFLGLAPGDDISGVSPLKIAQAMTLSEGGAGSLAARNHNPGNLKNADGSFQQFPNDAAGLAAATALVQRKIAGGQTTLQSMIEGLPMAGSGGRGKAPPPPKAVNTANMKALDAELLGQMGVPDWAHAPFDTTTIANLRARAAANYQRTGNPVLAAQQSIQTNKDMKKARATAPAASPVAQPLAVKPTTSSRPAGVPADARQRGDGKWFWKRGNQWFEGTV